LFTAHCRLYDVCCRAIGGIILQVGSALAYRGIPLQSAYCGAKHAIQGFTESLRCELLHDKNNVKVTMVQMPGMNTPQFTWVKNRLPKKPQPVPPVYQPDVAAEAIYHAAHHYRREWYVGGSTAVAISGNKLAPGLGDWYLGKTGFDSQQTDEPADPNAPNNLYEPLPGDHGAHGQFDRLAHDYCLQLWTDQHRGWLAVGGLLALLGGWALLKRGRQIRDRQTLVSREAHHERATDSSAGRREDVRAGLFHR
jgi:hypothetical protein